MESLQRLYESIPWLMVPVGFALFVSGLLRPHRREVRWIQVIVLAWFITTAVITSFAFYYIPRYYVPFVPFALVFAGDMVWWLVEIRQPAHKQRVALGIIVTAVLLLAIRGKGLYRAAIAAEPPAYSASTYVDTMPENQAAIEALTREGTVVASNLPWSVAWQADRPAVPIPPSPDQLGVLEQRYGLVVGAVYLSSQFGIDNAPPEWATWDELRQQQMPLPGFFLARKFPDGALLYLRRVPEGGDLQ
jgi:hypothetical protein